MRLKKKSREEKLLEKIVLLGPLEFMGICKILGIELYEEDREEEVDKEREIEEEEIKERVMLEKEFSRTPRPFEEIWGELCDKVEGLNRTRFRNLNKLVSIAIKKGK